MLSWLTPTSAKVAPGRETTLDELPTGSTSSDEIDIQGDQLPEMSNKKLRLRWWDLWALGVSTAIGGHFYLYQICFLAGFGHYIIAYFLIASAYGMLALCMAELSSALPFAGGAYGIARVTLGTLPGFLVGCFDAYQSMFNASYAARAMSGIISFVGDVDKRWEPLWWLIIFSSYLIIHIVGGPWMWRFLKLCSFGSVAMLLIYICGSIKYANFEENAPLWIPIGVEGNDRWFQGGADLFFRILPVPCWLFVGTESINLACHDCEHPKRDVPRAYLLTFVMIFCTSLATIFIGASVLPGATLLPYYPVPSMLPYMRIFDIDMQTACILALPAIYTSGVGFTYYYGSQLRAMGKSGLANPWLGYDVPGFKTPVLALVFGTVVAMCVCLRYYWWEPLPNENLLSISVLGAAVTYCSQFISLIMFRLYYPTIKREFSSPLGIAGSVYGLLVFLIVIAVIIGIEEDPAIIYFAVYLSILLLYYFLVVRHRQVFSEEEKTVLFKAYLMKSNRARNARLRTGGLRSSFIRAAATEDTPMSQSVRIKPAGEGSESVDGSHSSHPESCGKHPTGERVGRSGSDDPSSTTRTHVTYRAGSGSGSGTEEAGGGESTFRLSSGGGYVQMGPVPSIPEDGAFSSLLAEKETSSEAPGISGPGDSVERAQPTATTPSALAALIAPGLRQADDDGAV